jgi:hypothetical protein
MMERRDHINPWADKLQDIPVPEMNDAWKAMEGLLEEEMPVHGKRDRRRWVLLIILLLLLIGVCNCPGRLGRFMGRQDHGNVRRAEADSGGKEKATVERGDADYRGRKEKFADSSVEEGKRMDERGTAEEGEGKGLESRGREKEGNGTGKEEMVWTGARKNREDGIREERETSTVMKEKIAGNNTGREKTARSSSEKEKMAGNSSEKRTAGSSTGGKREHNAIEKKGAGRQIGGGSGERAIGGDLKEGDRSAGDTVTVSVKGGDTVNGNIKGGDTAVRVSKGKDTAVIVKKAVTKKTPAQKRTDSVAAAGKKADSMQADHKGWVAGIGLNQFFTVGQQEQSNYNSSGTTGGIRDYIPVPMIRYYFNKKLFVQLEAQFNTPQYTKKDLLASESKEDTMTIPTAKLQSVLYIKKLFYFNLPLSVHYSPFPNFYVGAGLQFSRLTNGVGLFQEKASPRFTAGPDSIKSSKVQSFKNDTTYQKMKTTELRLLLDLSYTYKKFIIGARYNRALSNFIDVRVSDTQVTQSRNSSIQVYLRYILWDGRKKKLSAK